jgi:hypothetical protein
MRFGTWNVSNFSKSSTLKSTATKFAKYKSDLMAVQGEKWHKSDIKPADDYSFLYIYGNVKY